MLIPLGAFILLSLTSACHWLNFEPTKNLTLDAPSDVELVLYRQSGAGEKRVLTPVTLLKGGESIVIEPGDYMLANECSGYVFKQGPERVTKIPVRRLSLVLHGEPEAQSERTNYADALAEVPGSLMDNSNSPSKGESTPPNSLAPLVHTQCRDPLDGQKSEWTNRRVFELLPGDTELKIAGKSYQVKNFGETSENISVDLYPVKILSEFGASETRFYITATDVESKSGHPVIGVPANGSTWLLPGQYSIEVNGSRKKLSIEKGAITEVSVGVIRVEIPADFPIEQRLKAGGQPVFVYLDGGALLNPDTDYVVFPGIYTVSIEGSEVQERFEVLEGKRTLVKTFAARVDAPPCPSEVTKCKRSPPITIHKEQKPYALMTVDTGLPFLLLEGSFEYGVEGMRGIKKSLTRRGDKLAVETLARVNINWQLRSAQGRYRTDLVRLESKSSNGFGKSLDLLFHKPNEVLVPAGAYDLTYFLGDPLLERSKSRQLLILEPGQTREVTVPVYIGSSETVEPEKLRGNAVGGAARKPDKGGVPANPAVSLPKKLVPLRR